MEKSWPRDPGRDERFGNGYVIDPSIEFIYLDPARFFLSRGMHVTDTFDIETTKQIKLFQF